MRGILNLENRRFGKLIALEPIYIIDEQVLNKRKWKCICDCGNEVITDTFQLTSGNKKSCGCLIKTDLTGNIYTFVKVISFSHLENRETNRKRKVYIWNCLCHCGNEFKCNQRYIISKNNKLHCGCLTSKLISESSRKGFGIASKNKLIGNYRERCKRKNIEITLTNNELVNLFGQNCHYCNKPPSRVIKNKKGLGDFLYNGIDRMNNNEGYIHNNVVSCCAECNYLKSNYSYSEFLKIIKTIYENLILNNEKTN